MSCTGSATADYVEFLEPGLALSATLRVAIINDGDREDDETVVIDWRRQPGYAGGPYTLEDGLQPLR